MSSSRSAAPAGRAPRPLGRRGHGGPGALSALVLAVGLAAARGGARAETVDATATTLLAGVRDPRDGEVRTVVPSYLLVSLRAAELRSRWLEDGALVFSGWGALDAGAPDGEALSRGDVDLAYAEGRLLRRRLTVRVGRQLVLGGVTRTAQLDGVSAAARLGRALGLELHGGVPVTPRFGVDRGDAQAGARLSLRRSIDAEVGLAFVSVLDGGREARRDVGVDARYVPGRAVTLGAHALASALEGRLAEAALEVGWQPGRTLGLEADLRHTAPDLFLPRSSILAVFSDESRDELGGALHLRPAGRLRADLEGHWLLLEEGSGHRLGARGQLDLDPARAGVELSRLGLPDGDGYVQARLFVLHRLSPGAALALDADTFLLDRPINGEELSLTATASASWAFAPEWLAVVSGVGGATPFLARRYELVARAVYRFSTHVREVAR